uniref:Secreted protein n=1 Tax=Mesocestoides corti TaxID=53468 RepID=A0A5K3FIE2_MESCO
VNEACSVVSVFFLLVLGYSTRRRIRAQTCWTTWLQPILCPSAFQWHARKISSQPVKDTTEMQVFYNDDGSGLRHIRPPGLRQSCVSLLTNCIQR